MRATEVRLLFGYNDWANGRVLDAAAKIPAARLVDPAPVSHGSLLGTLAHVLAAESVWRVRSEEGVSPATLLTDADFPTVTALRGRSAAEAEAMRAFLDGLRDDDLEGLVHYTTTEGVASKMPLWQILLHVVNHGTQFRAEAAMVLSEAGHSPGNLDLMAYLASG
jgi:uncharacterized damage-inducible protein DinB